MVGVQTFLGGNERKSHEGYKTVGFEWKYTQSAGLMKSEKI